MNLKVFSIDLASPYLEQVIKLGETNRVTLGFFPRGAFEQHASKKWIIVAIDQDMNTVIGYLLYGVSRGAMIVYIVHLCVETAHRKNGVAKALFDELILISKKYRAIRVHCRVDYDANSIWPKLGFSAVNEIPGRSKSGSTLRVWWFEHDHPSLFSYAKQQEQNQKINVAIDANVFFQLQYPDIGGHEESTTLLEPWLDINLHVTKEIFNEIARNPDSNKRKQGRQFANSFEVAKSSDSKFQASYQSLLPLFPKPSTASDESDIRQLARAISSDISFFVTRDEFLLTKSPIVYEKFGVKIVRPSDLIIQQDEILHEDKYSPAKLAGSKIHIERVHSNQSARLIITFLSNHEETKKSFNHKIQRFLGDPVKFESLIIKDIEEDLGLIIYGREDKRELHIPVLRLKRKSISPIIARYLVNDAVLMSSKEGRFLTRISDEFLSSEITAVLDESGFSKTKSGWIKINLSGAYTLSRIEHILSIYAWPEYAHSLVQRLNDELNGAKTEILIEIEKVLWPLKINDIDIPSFIIPIRPEWAMHLFDDNIAEQDLFGSEPSLILNAENVYYRSSRPKIPVSPSRILWYVSKGKGRYQGSMQIKACSYVEEVCIDKPKSLFAKYSKLGIYKWPDVYRVADNDLEKKLMAFKFSKTEVFTSPIPYDYLEQIWMAQGKNFNVSSPLQISKEQYFEIYNMGIKEKK
jgi:ribosomal protein S18 acetylase RimI-like enzyme